MQFESEKQEISYKSQWGIFCKLVVGSSMYKMLFQSSILLTESQLFSQLTVPLYGIASSTVWAIIHFDLQSVNEEVRRTWKKTCVVGVDSLRKSHEKSQSQQPVSGCRDVPHEKLQS